MTAPTPGPYHPEPDGEPELTDSQLRAEALPRRFGRNAALALMAVALVTGALGFVFFSRARRASGSSDSTAVATTATAESPLLHGKRLLTEGDLDGADKILRAARAEGDSAELQEAMSEVAEQLGNRLGALAHMHRATRLSPNDAEPRARLAALLLRLGQPAEACRQAQLALQLDAGARATAARSVITHARCRQ